MTKSEITAILDAKRGWLPGKRIKIDFGSDGVVMLDGVAEAVTEEDGAADTVIGVSWADLKALGRRELDPMAALMQGRIRIDGDFANALHLQRIFADLGGAA
jgi:putative sterol carrier protein